MDLFDVRPLRALAMVSSAGSISSAARRLGITQQALSARIRAFEREIGIELLHRSPRGSSLTPEGDLLVSWSRDALVAMDRFSSAVASLRQHGSTDLVVAASQTVAAHLLPGWVVRLQERQAARDERPVAIMFDTANSDEVVRKVREGECAVGFIESPRVPGDLGSRLVCGDEMVVAVHPGHGWAHRATLSLEEVGATPLVVREAGSGTRAALETALDACRVSPAPPASVQSTEASVRSSIIAGVAPGVLSARSVSDDVALGRLRVIPFAPAPLQRPITAIWRGGPRDLHGAAHELLAIAVGSAHVTRPTRQGLAPIR
jgi:DNA-binding transcriptional LysR family regulator